MCSCNTCAGVACSDRLKAHPAYQSNNGWGHIHLRVVQATTLLLLLYVVQVHYCPVRVNDQDQRPIDTRSDTASRKMILGQREKAVVKQCVRAE